MCYNARIILLLACGLWSISAAAQRSEIDSLYRLLNNASTDTARWYYSIELSAKYLRINTDTSLMYGQQSLSWSGNLGNGKCKATSLNTLGATYWSKGEHETALRYYFDALKTSEERGFAKLTSTIYGNIGMLYSERHDPDRALEYLRKSLALKYEIKDTLGIMRALNNIGEAYVEAKQPDSALVSFLRCVPFLDIKNESFGKGIVFNNIGTIYFHKKDYANAADYYNRSRSIREQIGDNGGLSVVLGNLGDLALARNDPSGAIGFYERSLALNEKTVSASDRAAFWQKLSGAYAAQGNFTRAYDYLHQYVGYRDSLYNKEREERMAEMEVRYQTGLKEAEIARQQLQIERARSRQRMMFFSALGVVLALGGLFQFLRNRQRLRQREAEHNLILREAEATRLRELDQVKSSFFANISHEFRTPLTLILGPVQKWLREQNGRPEIALPAKDLNGIRRSASRLLDLVNQLLDLSKIESGRMRLSVGRDDLTQTLRVLGNAFESMAEQGNIRYRIDIPSESVLAWFDRDKLEKICSNLLSNAFKHTPPGGTVQFSAGIENDRLRLSVRDTGKGIAAQELDKIFERFYQVEGSGEKGTGIGLALVKELVSLHKGEIFVESRPEEGSVFSVTLPVGWGMFAPEEIVEPALATSSTIILDRPSFAAEGIAPPEAASATDDSLPLCLVVEDNVELQAFIRDQLVGQYRVHIAANGRQGLDAALELIPDLIISDVMMPEMDGNRMCAALKTDERTSHIPVILLTAKAGQESRIEGLETGADDYLTKPFDTRELLVRAGNLITQRERLRKQFSRTVVLKPKDIALTSADERFLQRIQDSLDAHLSDEQFSVEELAAQVGMSRSQLHRKLTALIDQPPVEFIRNFRLRRAKEMLEAGTGNVSEICFEVGFSSPAYFSKAFKDAFGMSPSEVRKG